MHKKVSVAAFGCLQRQKTRDPRKPLITEKNIFPYINKMINLDIYKHALTLINI